MQNAITERIEQARASFMADLDNVQYQQVKDKPQEVFDMLNQDLLLHVNELTQALDSLSDEASQEQFLNFLSGNLATIFNRSLALRLNRNFPQERFLEIGQQMPSLLEQKGLTIPQLDFGNTSNELKQFSLVTNFAIEQYCYPGWVEVNEHDVFFDCGAFVGETTCWALQKGAQVYAFEPFKENFDLLTANLKHNGYTNHHCFNCAVEDQNTVKNICLVPGHESSAFIVKEDNALFQSTMRSNAEEREEHKINCVRIDDFVKSAKAVPTLIKMDIEGSELSALKGAAETIRQHQPKLAICLYHKNIDLWSIPLYIKSLVPEYKLFCRENAPGSEFVLYAATKPCAD